MSLTELLFGKRLASDEEEKEQIGPLAGIPVLGLDALASASYGPEAALTVLIPLGALATRLVVPISLLIIALLVIVYASYRQTIGAYPNGGGSYTVARENLGTSAGLVAASALLIDYVLNVSVAISAGVGALVSAVPALLPHTTSLCLFILALLTLTNLRGVRSAGLVLMTPTYLFLGCLFSVIALGAYRALTHGGHPLPVIAPPAPVVGTVSAASAWLLCHSFASGCTAMTGVEAVSNGVPAFRPPGADNARRTLAAIIASLVVLLAGVALLARAYGITATIPGQPGYQSILSQIVAAVVGRGAFYQLTLAAVVAVLAFSANTSFADFPRLCRILSEGHFLPERFVNRGRRLAFSYGIFVLSALSAALLVAFHGLTEGLIPLFAIGAFLSFTMSQAGMVVHFRRALNRDPHARLHLVVNAVGAFATAITFVIILASKFAEGAWISAVLVVACFLLLRGVGRHHARIEEELRPRAPIDLTAEDAPIVVVPMRRWDLVAHKGLRFAVRLSPEVYALQILRDDRQSEELTEVWGDLVEAVAKAKGLVPPRLVVVRSRYRRLFRPMLRFVTALSHAHPDKQVVVVVPEVVESRWYHALLHNHTALLLKWLLRLRGNDRTVVISIPWHLRAPPAAT